MTSMKTSFPTFNVEKHNRVIFAGYPEFADEFIQRLQIGVENEIGRAHV